MRDYGRAAGLAAAFAMMMTAAPAAPALAHDDPAETAYQAVEALEDKTPEMFDLVAEEFPGTFWARLAEERARAMRVEIAMGVGDAMETASITPADTAEDFGLFQECETCPEMMVMPGGVYTMGAPTEEPYRGESERAPQEATVARFALSRTEITVAAYRRFVEATGRSGGDRCWTSEGGYWAERENRDWRNPGFVQSDDHPVACVSRADAEAFVDWLNAQVDGAPYRLPTEAEWEYAARGDSRTAYFWGGVPEESCRYANGADFATRRAYPSFAVIGCDDGHVHTAPVGGRLANPFGLADMSGNVFEMTAACGLNAVESDESACRGVVLRGGAWNTGADCLRAACRHEAERRFRANYVGFRLARSL